MKHTKQHQETKKTETVHYNLLQHGFDQDTQIAISANKLRPNGDITKSRRPPPLKRELTTETKLELETTTSDFLNCMCTAATGPPISDDDPLQKLQLPPEIKTGATVTLNDLRKHAREIANSKIMTLPYLTQAAHLAGTYITPTDLKQFTTATTTKVKETTTKEKETTTSQREMEISLISKKWTPGSIRERNRPALIRQYNVNAYSGTKQNSAPKHIA